MTPVSPDAALAALNWRYAVKKFDPAKKIPADTWAALEQSLVLSPSSYGLQPWKFFVVETPAVREQLLPHSWGQKQIVDASHLVVFALKKDMGAADAERLVFRDGRAMVLYTVKRTALARLAPRTALSLRTDGQGHWRDGQTAPVYWQTRP